MSETFFSKISVLKNSNLKRDVLEKLNIMAEVRALMGMVVLFMAAIFTIRMSF